MDDFSMTYVDHFHQTLPAGKMLILGWGREGKSTRKLLNQLWPDRDVWVADEEPQNFTDAHTFFHEQYLRNLGQFSIIWKSPGISQDLPEIQEYLQQGGKITTQLNEVLSVYRQKIIGVTGTKGKSTTSTLITESLKAAGKSVVLAGNIGIPLFDRIDQFDSAEWIVIEMSSYMLDSVSLSPHVAVFLNLYDEHLNYHGNREKYAYAKKNITKFQTAEDWLIVNESDQTGQELMKLSAAQIKTFTPAMNAAPLSKLSAIVTQHNWPAVLAVAEVLNIPETATKYVSESFIGLPHRLEKVATIRDVSFYDDTLATVPEAAIAALQSVPNVSVMLLGGYDRGIAYDQIIEAVVAKKVPYVFLFPPSGEKMAALLSAYPEAERPQFALVQTMEEAVAAAFKVATPGSAVLLSPASPSFGQFHDYEQKSEAFKAAVARLSSS